MDRTSLHPIFFRNQTSEVFATTNHLGYLYIAIGEGIGTKQHDEIFKN